MTCFVATSASAQDVEIIKYPALKQIIEKPEPKVKLINFWATWCAPCIKELPYFEAIHQDYDQVAVYLVSLDFIDQLENRLMPFLKKKDIHATVKVLNETDLDPIINDINPEWSGAIPATLIIAPYNKEKAFFEKAFQEGELEFEIKKYTDIKP